MSIGADDPKFRRNFRNPPVLTNICAPTWYVREGSVGKIYVII
jgi:hypothetical protein